MELADLIHSRPLETSFGIVLFCLIVYVGQIVFKRVRERQADQELARRYGCELPPEIPKRWPLGIDWIKKLFEMDAEGHLLAFLSSVADEYEPRNNAYQFFLVGPRLFHILHPANVEVILSSNFKDYGFGVRSAVFAPLLGNGIFTQEGAEWKHSRELLRKQFMRAQYQKLDHFREHVDNLISRIGDGGEIDLQPLFFDLTLDAATAVLFGSSVYSLRANIDQNAKNRQFAEDFNLAQEGLAKRYRLAPLHFLYNPSSFRKACKRVHAFLEDYIRTRKRDQDALVDKSESFFFDRIAEESSSDGDTRDQLLNVLLAGRDTTACCLSWTVRLLVRHPATLARARKEIQSIVGDNAAISRDQIRNMPFLACVIKESLRLYPSVPMNNRTAMKSTVLPTGGGPCGHSPMLVRKGEVVSFSPYCMARRKNLFGKDAECFRPERWETGKLADVGYAYFPFNGGPRQCLGEGFALMEVSYTLVRLIQTYKTIELPEGDPNEPAGTEKQRLSLVLSAADGCKVSIG